MLALLQLLSCKTTENYYTTEVYEGPEVDAASWATNEPDCAAPVPLEELNVFDEDGVAFYFELLREQVALMDERACSGESWFDNSGTYELGADDSQCPTYVEQAWVFSPDGLCAETGKIELTTFGESSRQYWVNPDDGSLGIPNIRIDFGEFQSQRLADGTSHLRLSNGQASSGLVRLDIAARIWRAMGYPAPRTSFVRAWTNLWDNELSPGTWAAYTAFEPYKKRWVHRDDLGYTSIWEGVGDPLWGEYLECWWSEDDECEDALLSTILEQLVQPHEDLMAETVGLVDWTRLHQNLCLYNTEHALVKDVDYITQLGRSPQVIGFKDSSMDAEFLDALIEAAADNPDFEIYQGMEMAILPEQNVDGYFIALANVEPAFCAQLPEVDAEKLQQFIKDYDLESEQWYVRLKQVLYERSTFQSSETIV